GSPHRRAPRSDCRCRSQPSYARGRRYVVGQRRREVRKYGGSGVFAAFKSPANTPHKVLQPSLQGFVLTFPRILAPLRSPSPSRLPMKSPHLAAHTTPNLDCGCVWRAAAVRLQGHLTSARCPFGRRGPGPSSVVTAPPTAFM